MLYSGSPLKIFWGVITSMYIGNAMLLVLNLPLIPLWVKILKIPYYLLFPLILIFCVIGSYSINNSLGDVITMIIFGFLGFLMRKYDYEGAPLIMALVLGKVIENAFRQSLILSKGSLLIFFTRPISATMILIAILVLISPIIFKKRPLQEIGG